MSAEHIIESKPLMNMTKNNLKMGFFPSKVNGQKQQYSSSPGASLLFKFL